MSEENWWNNIRNTVGRTYDQAKKASNISRDEFNSWVNETKPNIDLNPFDDNKITISFGNDKSPVQFGQEIEFSRGNETGLQLPIPFLPRIKSVNQTQRAGGWGSSVGTSFGIDDLLGMVGGKPPISADVIYPDLDDPSRAVRDPNFRNKLGYGTFLKNLFGQQGRPTINEDSKEFKDQLRKNKEEADRAKNVGGFTVPKGVLGADQGIYAAVLNGKQGFLDKTTGKWQEYENLTAEQKGRLASDFINDPQQLARALPEGSYSKQSLYLPEFQPVKL